MKSLSKHLEEGILLPKYLCLPFGCGSSHQRHLSHQLPPDFIAGLQKKYHVACELLIVFKKFFLDFFQSTFTFFVEL